MFLSHLSLDNFRSYEHREFQFENNLTVIIGENGKGKTNILEAIYALATIKPFRSHKREAFMKNDSSWTKISGIVQKEENNSEKLSLFWDNGKKFQAKYNEIPMSSAKDFLYEKSFLAVLFAPEDLFLPFLSPSYRRTTLSRILSPMFPEYFFSAMQYEKALKQRNALLKKKKEGERVAEEEFIFWNKTLCHHHDILWEYHDDFFVFMKNTIPLFYKEISGKNDHIEIIAQYSAQKGKLEEKLLQDFSKDIAKGSTSSGIHKDDFGFTHNHYPIESHSSRGEIRSVILAFKKAEQLFLETNTKQKPIILLDDVFSELDISHQQHLLASLNDSQCIITTTELHFSVKSNVIKL